MLIILVTSIGLAIFAFLNGHYIVAALALAGLSRTVGMVSLIAAGVLLIVYGYLWVGVVPLALVSMNLIPFLLSGVNTRLSRSRNRDEEW